MPQRVSVCHLLHHLARGGLETQLLRLVRTADDHVSFTVSYIGEDASMRSEYETAGVKPRQVQAGSDSPLRQFSPGTIRELVNVLTTSEVEILHVHGELYLLVLARLCGRIADIPVMGTYHNPAEGFSRPTQMAEQLTRPLSTVDIAVSRDVERTYSGSAQMYTSESDLQRETYTIHNGIDVGKFSREIQAASTEYLERKYDLDNKLVFLNIGRYTEQKNQRALIRAMSAVTDGEPESDVHLFVVGWGPNEDSLKQLAATEGVEDSVTIAGRVENVSEYYSVADCFVLSSQSEGLSVVLLEAMAAGLPVVGTDVSGTAEAIVDGETGAVVTPDSPRELAEKMQEMTAEERRRRLGRNGHQRAREQFSIERTAQLYTSLYQKIKSSK